MTDSSIPPSAQEDSHVATARQSPWVMFISMALLICGLLLASAMLLHYALQKHGGADGSGFNFAQVAEKARALMESKAGAANAGHGQEKPPAAQMEGDLADLAVKKFFSPSGDGVKWPRLKLEGFGKATDGKGGFAIINGKQTLVGETIGDVKLVEVRTQGVLVELGDEQRFLSVELGK